MQDWELDDRLDGSFEEETQRKTRKPRRYKVLIHNDDYTTMDFVVEVLVRHFRRSPGEATQIMLQVHHQGVGVAGVFPKEMAETKIAEVTDEARALGMPLLLTSEAE